MKVLAIIQVWNRDDPIRGFTVRWMEELADRLELLVVLTLEQQQPPTRANILIYSLGKEMLKGSRKRFYYLRQWHCLMLKIFTEHAPDVIFTHMTPIYSVLAAPYAQGFGVSIIT